ncbi:MAG TPA: Hsp70 family protein [Acidimicrobiales bacterium]
MSYYLGVDVGTSNTAAAVWRDGVVEVVALGGRGPVVPSAVLVRENGEVLTGEEADAAFTAEPLRLARDFRRRLGEPGPVLDAEPHTADELTVHLVRAVLDAARERQGGDPAGVAASHPLTWPESRREALRRAFAAAGVADVGLVSDPHAAALHHGALDGFVPGSVVAVYDLGGGTFDAAALFATESGWELLGRPEGIDRLGGVDVDDLLFNHVADSLGGALEVLDPDDPTHLAAVARLRLACVEAKEALSSRPEVPLGVAIPTMLTTVPLSRSELEKMVRPSLDRTIDALANTLRSAGVETPDLTAVLVMGGASRMPLVTELIGTQLGRAVEVAAEPKLGVALGAAMAAAGRDVPDVASATLVGVAEGGADGPADGGRGGSRAARLAAVGSAPADAATGRARRGRGPAGAPAGRSTGASGGGGDGAQVASATAGAGADQGVGSAGNGSGPGPAAPAQGNGADTGGRAGDRAPAGLAPVGPLAGGSGARGGPTADRRTLWLAVGLLLAVVVVALAVALAGGEGGGGDDDRARTERSTTTAPDHDREADAGTASSGPATSQTSPSSTALPGGPALTVTTVPVAPPTTNPLSRPPTTTTTVALPPSGPAIPPPP